MRRLVWLALLLAVLPLTAAAQETRGNINGVVEDQGGVVPGAAVRITNTGTSQTQQLTTNEKGYFEALLLNPGTYDVRVELQVQDLDPDGRLAGRRANPESDVEAGSRSAHGANRGEG